MSTSISQIRFDRLFEQEKILGTISPETISGSLNLAMRQKDPKTLIFALKDSTSYAEIEVSATILASDPNETLPGILLEYQKLLYILHSYSSEDLEKLEITVQPSDGKLTSSVLIKVSKDKILLPHALISAEKEKEYVTLHDSLEYVAVQEDFVWNNFNEDQKTDLLTGISNGLQFVSPDEQKNNALALYKDKIIVNDRRHVFLYNFDSELKSPVFSKGSGVVPIHKKIIRIIFMTAVKNREADITISYDSESFRSVYLKSNGLTCRLNNALSNIAPPSEDDLKKILPSQKPFTVNVKTLLETSKFFNGLYSSATATSEWNPIVLESRGVVNELVVSLKDSGIAGYSSCSIERVLPCKRAETDEFSVFIINDSLRAFLSNLSEEEVSIVPPKDTEPAVYVATSKTEIFLVKLV